MTVSEIKQEFFRYRNGIVADALKRAGDPHTMIFGLDVPRLRDMALNIGFDDELASSLWADVNVRESRLLACWIMDPSETREEMALRMAAECITREEADMLAFRLLKRMKNPAGLLKELESKEEYALAASSLRRHLE